jgi:hypothetical protein
MAPSFRSLALFGMGRGEPVSFLFILEVQTLSPWSSLRPVRRLALKWQRGTKVRLPRLGGCASLTREARSARA